MHFSKFLAISGLAAVMFVPAVATQSYAAQVAAKTSVAVDDTTLHARVHTAIDAQEALKSQNIDVTVVNAVVTLTGAVQTQALKTRAANVAMVPGVTKVVNQLLVDPKNATRNLEDKTIDATKTAAKKTGEGAKVVGEKTADGAKVVGEKTKDGAVATKDMTVDATINTKIHGKMVDEPTLKGSDVNVDVKDNMVVLKGTVLSAAGKARAEAIAKDTAGVKGVSNMLTIGPKK
jgi:osmotically-inducible protein OsmY